MIAELKTIRLGIVRFCAGLAKLDCDTTHCTNLWFNFAFQEHVHLHLRNNCLLLMRTQIFVFTHARVAMWTQQRDF